MNQERGVEEVAFILNEPMWPRWPLLPVKRYPEGANDLQPGVIVAGYPKIVYLKNLWEFKSGFLPEQLEGVEKIKYDSVESLVADGWVVD